MMAACKDEWEGGASRRGAGGGCRACGARGALTNGFYSINRKQKCDKAVPLGLASHPITHDLCLRDRADELLEELAQVLRDSFFSSGAAAGAEEVEQQQSGQGAGELLSHAQRTSSPTRKGRFLTKTRCKPPPPPPPLPPPLPKPPP